jgi:hypothetical protein
MRRPFRPRPPAPPPVEAGYWLEEQDPDHVRAAKVLVSARRQGREREAEERARAQAAAAASSAIERMRAAARAQGGRT